MRIHIHVHDAAGKTTSREVFTSAQYEELVERLLAALDAPTTDEGEGHKFHGNQYVTVATGPKPEVATAKGVKAGVAQLLASGHKFTLAELQKATGAKLGQQIHNAVAELKKSTPPGGLMLVKEGDHYSVKMQGINPDLLKELGLGGAAAPVPLASATPAAPIAPPTPVSAPPAAPPVAAPAAEPAAKTTMPKAQADVLYKEQVEESAEWLKQGLLTMPTAQMLEEVGSTQTQKEFLEELLVQFKEAKATAMAQWASNVNGVPMQPVAKQQVFKADHQLAADLMMGKSPGDALVDWKKNTAGEKAGTWPAKPTSTTKSNAELYATAKPATSAVEAHPPHFEQVKSYVPADYQHVSADDFTVKQGLGMKPMFQKQMETLKSTLSNSDAGDAVSNKKGVQSALTERLKASKPFQSLIEQRKAKGYNGSLEASLISSWASTSGDHNPVSVANQIATREAFGMSEAGISKGNMSSYHSNDKQVFKSAASDLGCNYETEAEKTTFENALRDFALAQYHSTQDHLAKLGVKELYIARGMKISAEGKVRKVSTKMQPASSFSANHATAHGFSGGASMFYAKVPASQVLSTYVTGFGCTSEHEIVVLAHPGLEMIQAPPSVAMSDIHAKLTGKKPEPSSSPSAPKVSVHHVAPPPAGSIALHANAAYEAAKNGDLQALMKAHSEFLAHKQISGKNLPKTTKYFASLMSGMKQAAYNPPKAAGAPGAVKKNAHYYKKLKQAIESHPTHSAVAYSSLKAAGFTNEQILAKYKETAHA